jgi:hypothetical protein
MDLEVARGVLWPLPAKLLVNFPNLNYNLGAIGGAASSLQMV